MVKKKKLSIFHGFCPLPPPRISSSLLFFVRVLLYHHIHPSTTDTISPVLIFFRTLTRAYLLHRCCIYTRPLVDDVNFSFVRVRKLLFFSAAYPQSTHRSIGRVKMKSLLLFCEGNIV